MQNKRILMLLLTTAVFTSFNLSAHSDNHYGKRSDGHAPMGVMGDHFHNQGEWMITLRTMRMQMENETTDFNQPLMGMTPVNMQTQMTMLGGMYGLSDSVTLMANIPYLDRSMDMLMPNMMTGMNMPMENTSKGFGDLKLGSAIRLRETESDRLHTTVMVSLPTGSIDESVTRSMMMNGNTMEMTTVLPAMMQLGSGTYDLMSGITYVSFQDKTSYGLQWRNVTRFGENDRDYKLANQNNATAWGAYNFNDSVSMSLRGQYFTRAGVDKRWDVGVGMNFISAGGHRLAAEYLVPVEHDSDSVMEAQDYWTVGYQYSW